MGLEDYFAPGNWDVAAAILSLAAIGLSIITFLKQIKYQSYSDVDTLYQQVLSDAMDKPFVRDPDWIKNYDRDEDDKSEKGSEDKEKRLQYETYAFMAMNLVETIKDRNETDETWLPVIKTEIKLHYKWFCKNHDKFKESFQDYVNKLASNLGLEKTS